MTARHFFFTPYKFCRFLFTIPFERTRGNSVLIAVIKSVVKSNFFLDDLTGQVHISIDATKTLLKQMPKSEFFSKRDTKVTV